jgi:23S rRNA pseudouridine2605 synthase
MPAERLQKVLARSGFGSRRKCEELILQGRVRVDGKEAQVGQKVDPAVQEIRVDGELIPGQPERVYILLNKPRGVLSSTTAQGGRQTVLDLVPVGGHIYPVGRLDVDSEGLVLLTNDGELTNLLTHPRYGHEKEYRVRLDRPPDDQQLAIWRRGIVLADGTRTRPVKVQREAEGAKGAWIRVTMREGKKRQIRETARALGLRVKRLIRVRMGPLRLGDLRPGEWRYLRPQELAALRAREKGRKSKGGRGRREQRSSTAKPRGKRSES